MEKITRKASKTTIGRCKHKGMIGMSSSESWRQPDDRVAQRKHVCRIARTDSNRIVYGVQDSSEIPCMIEDKLPDER